MDKRIKKDNIYGRVVPRVNNRPRDNFKATSTVTRHETPSSVQFGAKPSSSNVSASVYRELPTVLKGYVPDLPLDKPKKFNVRAKPKKTLKSLDPAKSPISKAKPIELEHSRSRYIRASAPSLIQPDPILWSDSHFRQCLSSRSHTRLRELKDEIKEFQEKQKLITIQDKLYKRCGVMLDDAGQVAADKAVQVNDLDKTSDERLVKRKLNFRFK